MCSPKLLLISGGVGFILSFLISKIAGVGTGTALIRGICFFFGFGGAVFIGYVLVSKFIPELLSDSHDESFNNDESEGVDFTVDDNTTMANDSTQKSDISLNTKANYNETTERKDSFNSSDANQNFDDKKDNFSNFSGSSSSLSDIISEDSKDSNLSKDSVLENNGFKPGIPAEVVSSETQNADFVKKSSSADSTDSNLEELPDISNFDVGSVADVVASAENMQSISDVSAPISDVPIEEHKSDADTINMAKAIQTMLSKDR